MADWRFFIFFLFSRARELYTYKRSSGLMDNVSALQPRDRGFEPHTGHDHDFLYDTITRV